MRRSDKIKKRRNAGRLQLENNAVLSWRDMVALASKRGLYRVDMNKSEVMAALGA